MARKYQAPDWQRDLLYRMGFKRLERLCEITGTHYCIYPAGHMTKREAEVVLKMIREHYAQKDLDTDS
jgi:hypothetical protein